SSTPGTALAALSPRACSTRLSIRATTRDSCACLVVSEDGEGGAAALAVTTGTAAGGTAGGEELTPHATRVDSANSADATNATIEQNTEPVFRLGRRVIDPTP